MNMKTLKEYEVQTLIGAGRYTTLREARRVAKNQNEQGKHATIYAVRVNRYGEITDRQEVEFTRPAL